MRKFEFIKPQITNETGIEESNNYSKFVICNLLLQLFVQ